MATLSDAIERYLKQRLTQAGGGVIEIRRCDVADQFECVPSQINYVLETRFTPQRGYYVESRRGGGGFIRITRAYIRRQPTTAQSLDEQIGSRIGEERAEYLLSQLQESGHIDRRKESLIRGILRQETRGVEAPWKDFLRAKLLKVSLLLLLEEPREA